MKTQEVKSNKVGIDISQLLMCVEKEKDWMYVYGVVKWFQDNIYTATKRYGKDSLLVNRFISCLKVNKYCQMWVLRRILLNWGIEGSYKDIRKHMQDKTHSNRLMSLLLDKLNDLWIRPLDRGLREVPSLLFITQRALIS